MSRHPPRSTLFPYTPLSRPPPAARGRAADLPRSARWTPPFLSLATALENSVKDQTYNTPAVATLLLLADQVDWMLANGGLDWCVARTRGFSGHLYGRAPASQVATPFVTHESKRSLGVRTNDFTATADAAPVAAAPRS